jgi:glutathione reductase (NADPH)
VALGASTRGVEARGAPLVVHGVQAGTERAFETDLAVHGAGRIPDLDDLDLDAGGVKRERRGVSVNQFLQSVSNPAVYAGGDAAASGPPLTPKADHDVGVLVANLLQGNHRTPNYEGLASAVFTIPPLAAAGLGEDAARADGRRIRVNHQDTSGWFHTRRLGETVSGFKVLIDEGTDHVLGAHLLGPRADEVINLFAIAIRQRIPAREMQQVIFAYPTLGSDVRFML